MFGFFSKKKKQKEKDDKLYSDILIKLTLIAELLERQQQAKDSRNIHIDKVQIDYLENMVFRLDSLEIEELSGKLVIGNNISSTEDLTNALKLKIDKESAKQEAMSESSSSDEKKMDNTPKGYRFHYTPESKH